jgi:hypothetical protein
MVAARRERSFRPNWQLGPRMARQPDDPPAGAERLGDRLDREAEATACATGSTPRQRCAVLGRALGLEARICRAPGGTGAAAAELTGLSQLLRLPPAPQPSPSHQQTGAEPGAESADPDEA